MADKPGVIRILITDDHTIFCDGLKAMFGQEPEFKVVGEAHNGDEAIELVSRLRPDILLLDFLMPKGNGIDVLRALSESNNNVRTIILSGALEGDDISKAFELGARGFVTKDATTSMLFKSIRAVMAGQYWIGRQSVGNLVQTLKECKTTAKNAQTRNYGLTPRELQIIKAVVSGYPNKEIAGQFSISEQTVKHHITSVFDKLGVYNRLELTLFVFHHGIVEK
jgi:two-component system, NarL family, nitrate/nitrite response regulator NarL